MTGGAAVIPAPDAAAKLAADGKSHAYWDDSTQCASWIASDGAHVRCVTVTGLLVLEMADMWVSFGDGVGQHVVKVEPLARYVRKD